MSEVKVGDRVRIVVEDVVQKITSNGQLQVKGFLYPLVDTPSVVSIEVIEPPFVLPTKRWAQVLDMNGLLWTRVWTDEDYGHGWASTSGHQITNEQLLGASRLRVISEGVDDE